MAATEAIEGQAARPGPVTELTRDMRAFHITMIGVGAMIGAGIFALTGIAAGTAGPGLILAFSLNGLLTLCTAMVYAEVGSAIPGAGGGYLWTRFGLPGPSAFLTGWMDWLAHAVAGSLYAVVFGSYAVWGMQTIFGFGSAEPGGMGTLFGLPAIYFAKVLTAAVCFLFVWVNYRGSSETGRIGSIISVTKIIVIAIFLAFGVAAMVRGVGAEGVASVPIGEKFAPFLPKGPSGVLVAMGLTFIAFEGYEIIVQAGEEVVDPRRTIPRAVFWSLAIVIPIYVLVAIVCLGALSIPRALLQPAGPFAGSDTWAYLAALGETGVAEAANQFMPWGLGAILLVFGALLSTMSALNATTYSSTRVCFAMGRDHNLPPIAASISPKTRAPSVALAASGVLITTTALVLDAEKVAAATCVMFLLVFAGVNASAITIRRKYGDKLRYGYVMPFFPAIPIVAIVAQLAIAGFLFWHEPLSMYITAGWIAIGLGIYYAYSRHQEHELKATPIVFEQRWVAAEVSSTVLVPVANPSSAAPLVDLASRLARANGGGILILHVVAVPEQLPYQAADRFVSESRSVVDDALKATSGLPAAGLIRVAHHPARSIVDTVFERKCRTLVLGWSGPKPLRHGYGLRSAVHPHQIGTEIDRVLADADADTVVLRGSLPDAVRRVVIPVANPRQGQFAVKIAEDLSEDDGVIELVHVATSPEAAREDGEALMEAMFGAPELRGVTSRRGLPVVMKALVDQNAVRAIDEAASGADLLIIGASAESWTKRRAFTRFHYDLARRYSGPMLMVKLRSGRAKFALQRFVEFFASREPLE